MHVVDKQDFVSRNKVGANIIVASFDTTGVPRTWGMLITKMLGSNCANPSTPAARQSIELQPGRGTTNKALGELVGQTV